VPPWKPRHQTMPPMVPSASKGYPYAMRAQPLYVSGLCQILTEVFNISIYIIDIYIYTHRRRVYIYIVCFCTDMLFTHINIYTHRHILLILAYIHTYLHTYLYLPIYTYLPINTSLHAQVHLDTIQIHITLNDIGIRDSTGPKADLPDNKQQFIMGFPTIN